LLHARRIATAIIVAADQGLSKRHGLTRLDATHATRDAAIIVVGALPCTSDRINAV
jgi:hypothetical protein